MPPLKSKCCDIELHKSTLSSVNQQHALCYTTDVELMTDIFAEVMSLFSSKLTRGQNLFTLQFDHLNTCLWTKELEGNGYSLI